MTDDVRLVREAIDAEALLTAVADADAGANVLFIGTTRGLTDGLATALLEYEAHEPMALASLRRLRDEAVARFELTACAIVHRLGEVPVGQASVGLATSAPHRRSAFAAGEWLMERIKREVPIWKCEEGPDGARAWVHPGGAPEPDAGIAGGDVHAR